MTSVLNAQIDDMLSNLRDNEDEQDRDYKDIELLRKLLCDYLAALSSDPMTEKEKKFIREICGMKSGDSMRKKKAAEELVDPIPAAIKNMVTLDNIAFPVGQPKEFRKDNTMSRLDLLHSYGVLAMLDSVGNYFCGCIVKGGDTQELIRKRILFSSLCSEYIFKNVNDWSNELAPYVPAVPAAPVPLNGVMLQHYLMCYAIENPNGPSGEKAYNKKLKTPLSDSEMDDFWKLGIHITAFGANTSVAAIRRFTWYLRRGAVPDFAGMKKDAGNLIKTYTHKGKSGQLDLPYDHSIRWNNTEEDDTQENINEKQILKEIFAHMQPPAPGEESGEKIENGKKLYNIVVRVNANEDGTIDKDDANKAMRTMYNALKPRVKAGMPAGNGDAGRYQSMTLEELKEELRKLAGLNEVKSDLDTVFNMMQVNEKRKSFGLKPVHETMHMVFTGNPGTGKTTVARLIAAIYQKMGILRKGQFIETDTSGLIAEYVGQTAVKTRKLVEQAVGGVLFIDEAYMLDRGGGNDFADEAVAELIKQMEDHRDDLVVIFAGYTDLMNGFLGRNPGIRSRINKYISFPDYTGEEMGSIFQMMCGQYGLKPSDACVEEAEKYFKERAETKAENFANGRDVRNFLDKVLERQANRLAGSGNITEESLTELIPEDLSGIDLSGHDKKKKHTLGFSIK